MSDLDLSRALTTGAGGVLGSYVNFGRKADRNELDILDREAVLSYVREQQPTAVIHLAAATDTARCETDHQYAYALNVEGTLNVALAAEAVGAVLVYVSSSRVFAGEKQEAYGEGDVPDPQSIYGKSKYLGELITSTVVPEYLIVRGCWMFGGGPGRDSKFFGSIMGQLQNEEIAALGDVYGSPTYAKDFIESIKGLLSAGKRGVVHVSNEGMVTRSDIVAYLIKQTRASAKLKTVDRSYFTTGKALPTNEAIASSTVTLRSWQEALEEYLTTEWNQSNV